MNVLCPTFPYQLEVEGVVFDVAYQSITVSGSMCVAIQCC